MLRAPNAPPAELAVIYFPSGREEDNELLAVWAEHYRRSGNTATPVLVTTPTGYVSPDWPYRTIRPVSHTPPGCWTTGHRAIWLKLQAYRLLGRCVAIDADAYPVDYIGGLAAVTSPMAMPAAEPIDIGMPEPAPALSTGVMLINSPEFEKVYLECVESHSASQAARHPAYADQCAAIAHARIGGTVLDASYLGDPTNPGLSRIVHCRTNPQPSPLLPTPIPWLPENHLPLVSDRVLVVARFREDLGWLAGIRIPALVYDAGPEPATNLPRHVRRVPKINTGREAHAYCTHLVDHYNELAEYTVFCQGHPFDHSPGFVDRAYTHHRFTSMTTQYLPDRPGPEIKAKDRVETVDGYEVRYGLATADHTDDLEKNRPWLDRRIWKYVFDCDMPDPWWFGYGATYVVPRENILSRPLAFWRWLQSETEAAGKAKYSWSDPPLNAWAMEAIWYHLFSGATEFPHRADRLR